jgi:DNA recombination protein RmuC
VLIWLSVAVCIALLGTVVWIIQASSKSKDLALALLQQQITAMSDHLGRSVGELATSSNREIQQLHQRIDQRLQETAQRIAETHQSVGERIDRNTKLFGQVQEQLGRVQELGKGIQTVGEEITELQEILRAPKLRGGLGELFLEELLAQILPPRYFQMQYEFRGGAKVDAVIRLADDRLVPVDAKFPLENFRRLMEPNLTEAQERDFRKSFASDFRKHVDAIASKYIRPDEGTLDFALLYVPAENVYYEAILRDDRFDEAGGINNYALSKRVIPVSPNSFYAYLQAIVLGLKGLRIEERAREIYGFLSRFRGELEKLEEEFALVGRHLSNASSAFEKGQMRLEKVQGRVAEIEDSDADRKREQIPLAAVPDDPHRV